jgi:hypothetical protein
MSKKTDDAIQKLVNVVNEIIVEIEDSVEQADLMIDLLKSHAKHSYNSPDLEVVSRSRDDGSIYYGSNRKAESLADALLIAACLQERLDIEDRFIGPTQGDVACLMVTTDNGKNGKAVDKERVVSVYSLKFGFEGGEPQRRHLRKWTKLVDQKVMKDNKIENIDLL